jgi:hypothetical protein
MTSSPLRARSCAASLAALSLSALTALAPAAAHASLQPDRVFLQQAESARSRSSTAGLIWDLAWTRDWRGGQLRSYVEASIARWSVENAEGGRDTAAVTQIGLTPVLRWQAEGSPWFVEGGIGLNLIGPTYKAGRKRFSTAFNFGDHLAVGRGFGPGHRQELALRFQHFSNAGIKKPNPGEDFVQLRWSVRL